MPEYIEKMELVGAIRACKVMMNTGFPKQNMTQRDVMQIIEKFPAADVVAVVRCKDCFCFEDGMVGWCNHWQTGTDGTGYCSYGERRGEDG